MQEDVLEQLIGNRTAEGYDLFYKIMKRNGAWFDNYFYIGYYKPFLGIDYGQSLCPIG